MAFTSTEKVLLTIAFKTLRNRAEDLDITDFEGNFFDMTSSQQKAVLNPEVTSMRANAQAEVNGFTANQANLTARVVALDTLLTKL